jgi:hypothetical protein
MRGRIHLKDLSLHEAEIGRTIKRLGRIPLSARALTGAISRWRIKCDSAHTREKTKWLCELVAVQQDRDLTGGRVTCTQLVGFVQVTTNWIYVLAKILREFPATMLGWRRT